MAEISSYDANRRFIEMYGYKCSLLTDTEVITYITDYLLKKKRVDPGRDGVSDCGSVLVNHRTYARA